MLSQDVLVLGAGVAGITAARALKEGGLDVKVLEGRSLPGGRIRTDYSHFSFPDTAPSTSHDVRIPVDLGCSWIHGVQGAGNYIYSLASSAHCSIVKSHWERGVLFHPDGKRASESIVVWWLKLMSDVTEFFQEEVDDPHQSISEALDDYLDLNNIGKADKMTSESIFLGVPQDDDVSGSDESDAKSNLSADIADPVLIPKELQKSLARIALVIAGEWEWAERMEVLSALNAFHEGDGERVGADVMVPEGYWTIFERTVMKDIQDDIIYNAEVVKVEQPSLKKSFGQTPLSSSDSIRNRSASAPERKGDSKVTSNDAAPQQLVTVTTATGEVFSAKRVICALPLGVLKRDLVKFSPAISDHKCVSMARVGYGSMNKIYLQFDTPFWEPEDEVQPQVVIWMDDAGSGRLTVAVNHNVVVPHSNILCVMSTGESAFTLEQASDEEIIDEIMANLKRCYGPDTPHPYNHLITRWSNDKWSFGSSSSLVLGSSKQDLEQLARPEGRIHFAGEHTTSEHLGCVQGAYLSGIRAATEVLASFSKPPPQKHEPVPVDEHLQDPHATM